MGKRWDSSPVPSESECNPKDVKAVGQPQTFGNSGAFVRRSFFLFSPAQHQRRRARLKSGAVLLFQSGSCFLK